ncbi:MAG: hypothetical protein Q8873_03090 [Bacillota bacterium]|nr:hypothetical protein [Bacillota bacterium]
MKIVYRLKEQLVENIYNIEELEAIMENHKYFPSEIDSAEEDGILKFSNGRSQIYIKYSIKDDGEYIISDVTYCVKKTGKTQVHAFKNPADIKAMMDYFRDNEQNEWFLAFVLGLTLGRRVGDTLALKWSDFYYENGNKKSILNTVIEQKTNKTIEIKISESAWNYIEWYKDINSLNISECYKKDIF